MDSVADLSNLFKLWKKYKQLRGAQQNKSKQSVYLIFTDACVFGLYDGSRNQTLQEFALLFTSFVRHQTYEFLRSSTSTCNTPRNVTGTNNTNLDNSALKPSVAANLTNDKSEMLSSSFSSISKSKISSILSNQNDSSIAFDKSIKATPKSSKSLFSAHSLQKSSEQHGVQSSTPCKNQNLVPSKDDLRRCNDSNSFEINVRIHSNDIEASFNDLFKDDCLTPIKKNNSSSLKKSTGKKSKSMEKVRTPAKTFCLADFVVDSPGQKKRNNKDSSKNENKPTEDAKCSSKKKIEETAKPKKRVVPTLVASTTSSFTNPVLRSDNILKLTSNEILDKDNKVFLKEREMLKSQMNTIADSFKEESQKNQMLNVILRDKFQTPKKKERMIDLTNLSNKPVLDKLSEIYSALLNLNVTGNVLNDLSYLMNLLNTEYNHSSESKLLQENDAEVEIDEILINVPPSNDYYTVLRNVPNCVYFALKVLEKQKYVLALLDVTTLKVVLDNKRLENLNKNLKEFLDSVYNYKLQMDATKSSYETSFLVGHHFTNVFYQQDKDTRNFFTSDRECAAFKKQRDMFYAILKIWEAKHLSHKWNFTKELGPKIHSLLFVTENPINMSHLAKLFTSQLIISTKFPDRHTELETASMNVNIEKLAKLEQRLVTPSHFSTDYQFPGYQAFFKDFIINANSTVFIEQLKIALVFELVERNDSSYEVISLPFSISKEISYDEYMVRPEITATMRIIAKFLGFVMAQPFKYEESKNHLVDNMQVQLRNLVQPSFDVMSIFKKSAMEKKLLIIIPWLVQYLAMLDNVTVRLSYYEELLQLLYELSLLLKFNNASSIVHLRPTSIFILRCCIAWLFDQLNIPVDQLINRKMHSTFLQLIQSDMKDHSICNDKFINQQNKEEKSLTEKKELQSVPTNSDVLTGYKMHPDSFDELKANFHPTVENLLSVACPFLADFRVAIMPAYHPKIPSRSGRYRHITTKFAEVNTSQDGNDAQAKLTEAFLHSQSLSVRRIIEFVTERVTSAVIKDFQMEVLIPSKNEAAEELCKLESNELKTIYENKVLKKWEEEMENRIEVRVKKALAGLLPTETLDAVRNMCIALIIQKCKSKIEIWRIANLSSFEFCSNDVAANAKKQKQNSSETQKTKSTALCITDTSKYVPSKIFDKLQYLLHITYSNCEPVDYNELLSFCRSFYKCLNEHLLPKSVYRISGNMTVYLMQNLIQFHPKKVNEQLINKFLDIWLCDQLKNYVQMKTDLDLSKNEDQDENAEQIVNIFDGLITATFIRSLKGNPDCYTSLSELLVNLININLINMDFVNKKIVSLFQEDWPQDTLKHLSKMLDSLGKQTTDQVDDSDKSHLFMEMLSDLTRDMDDF